MPRKVVASTYITLDGFIDEPGMWSFPFWSEEAAQFKSRELSASDAQLLGRLTYEGFAAAWPTMQGTGEFGEKMNSMPKYVVSTTLTVNDATWQNSTVISGDVAAEISRVKEQIAGDILVAGSGQLVRTLAAHDLVDEYRLMVFPIVLGTGKRLFSEGITRMELRLLDSRPVGPDGVVILTYRPVR